MSEIVLKNITMTLDPASIQRAIEEVDLFEYEIKSALDGLCEYLLEYGVTVARMNLMTFGAYRTGALYNSIKHGVFDRTKGIGVITAGEGLISGNTQGESYELMSYAVYVEYGFGFDGLKSKHPLAKEQKYKYNRNKKYIWVKDHSQPGDVYIKKPGWVYFNENDDHFYFSQGQPAKPFMYQTLLDLVNYAETQGGQLIAQYIP